MAVFLHIQKHTQKSKPSHPLQKRYLRNITQRSFAVPPKDEVVKSEGVHSREGYEVHASHMVKQSVFIQEGFEEGRDMYQS